MLRWGGDWGVYTLTSVSPRLRDAHCRPFWLPSPALGKVSKEMHILAVDSGLEHTEVVRPWGHGYGADNICCRPEPFQGLENQNQGWYIP